MACDWKSFFETTAPTYRVTGQTWEVFDRDVWVWAPMPCTAYMGLPAICSARTTDKMYQHFASVQRRSSTSSMEATLIITIDRMSGAANWQRVGTNVYLDRPDFDRVYDDRGEGQCAPVPDPTAKPKPPPPKPRM